MSHTPVHSVAFRQTHPHAARTAKDKHFTLSYVYINVRMPDEILTCD
jgi:hypothetical protein